MRNYLRAVLEVYKSLLGFVPFVLALFPIGMFLNTFNPRWLWLLVISIPFGVGLFFYLITKESI